MKMSSNERILNVLELVIDTYIKTGEPVGSSFICAKLNNSVSSATIRNDMAKLERLNFLHQPYTSAGRIPTKQGFKIYINKLMKPIELSDADKKKIDNLLNCESDCVSYTLDTAVTALSNFTELAAISFNYFPTFNIISKIEVIPTGRRIYAVLIIISSGEVADKVCRAKFDISDRQIEFFKKVVNDHLTGLNTTSFDSKLLENLSVALGAYILTLSPLLDTLYEISTEISKKQVKVKGEENLLASDELDIQELLQFIATKDEMESLLSNAFSGINVIFGSKGETFSIGNSTLILTKLGGDEYIGSLGVIGPIRLDYRKIVPYVSYFAESVMALIDKINNEIKGGNEKI